MKNFSFGLFTLAFCLLSISCQKDEIHPDLSLNENDYQNVADLAEHPDVVREKGEHVDLSDIWPKSKIRLVAVNGPCNDNGTPDDPSDDYFLLELNYTVDVSPRYSECLLIVEVNHEGIKQTFSRDPLGSAGLCLIRGVVVPADAKLTSIEARLTCDGAFLKGSVIGVPPCSSACEITIKGHDYFTCDHKETASFDADDEQIVYLATTVDGSSILAPCQLQAWHKGKLVGRKIITGAGDHVIETRLPANSNPVDVEIMLSCNPACIAKYTVPAADPCSCGIDQIASIDPSKTAITVDISNVDGDRFIFFYREDIPGALFKRALETYESSFVVTGLDPSTRYEYRMRSGCDETPASRVVDRGFFTTD